MRISCCPRALVALALTGVVGILGGCPTPVPLDDGGSPFTGDSGPVVIYDSGAPPLPVDGGGNPDPGDGGTTDDGGQQQPSQVGVDGVSPPAGVLTGGYRVAITGYGFTPDTRVFFGDTEADQVLYTTEFRLTCRVPPGVDAGPVTVRVENTLGTASADNLFTYFSPVTLATLDPASGATSGGTAVTVTGEGFNDEMVVLVGGRQVVSLEVNEEGTSATFLTPPGVPGRVDVEALDTFGASTLSLAFTYVSALSLDGVSPAAIAQGAPAVVELRGAGFDRDTTVTVGGEAAPTQNLISEARLRVTVPATLPVGPADVAVTRGADSVTLDDALYVLPAPTGALAVFAALPARGDVAGGTRVALVGEGLDGTTAVTVGGTAATSFTVVSDAVVEIETPPGALGPAAIEVTTSDLGAVTFNGFSYVSALGLEAIDPTSGPAAGGTAFTLTGRGFADGMEVSFGGLPVTDLLVVDATTATGTTPAGASGAATVMARLGAETATLPDGFLYEADVKVLGAYPSRGGISGGTYVTIRGQGFSRDGAVQVQFGPNLATDVVVLGDSLIAARTPFHEPGVVDITVTIGAQSNAAEDAFTYFNPTFLLGGTRGGPIDGAVYITALDAFMANPVPDLACFVGTEGDSVYVSKTNILGQCTLSGPDLVGPQTVSIVGDGWEYATLVDVNASEITVYLQPTSLAGNPGGGQLPPPPPPATIRGRVTGFAKEFFDPAALGPDEIALAVVVTTAADEFSGTPNPGGENVVFQEGGEYFIANARPGRVALVALAGIFNLETTEFRLRQMGVRRSVYPEFGVNLQDHDIELTISLDQEIDLSLPDAPVRAEGGPGDGPTVTRVLPFLRFGGEGALAYTTAVNTIRNHDLTTMPDVPGEMLTFIAGAYTTDGYGLITEQGTISVTEGDLFATGQGTVWDQTDFFGRPLVNGQVLVIERDDGTKWATTVTSSLSANQILLARRPPFSGTGLRYHIGRPTYPSSEVVQDGVGDLIGGVTIQPVLGLPEPLSPVDNGVLESRTLRWKPAAGQAPTTHMHFLFQYEDWFDPASELAVLWTFYIDGARTKVPIPRIPAAVADLELEELPGDMLPGGVAWQHMAIYTPGFDYENFSYLDIGTRGRRAWTTDLHFFVNPGE